ncbi:MAG: glycerate dehydrogenase [Xanthomonadales bacterium]|nr:glycerate dehydrogenase [Xanthomonadales bacterium]
MNPRHAADDPSALNTMMRAARAVFLDVASLGSDVDLTGLTTACNTLRCFDFTAQAQLAERLHDANVVICNKTPLGSDLLSKASALELVLVTATGVNNVDLYSAAIHGIEVRNCRNYGTDAVAQHTMTLILALHTRLLDYQRDMAAGAWPQAANFCLLEHPILELAGRRLGIVGRGPIGRKVAELARAFGMEVVFAQLPGRAAGPDSMPWPELLRRVDVLSLHCPLNEATEHLLDAAALAAMRPGAMVINTARAGLIDTPALIAALRQGHLGGAAMDGLDVEPPPSGHPLLDSSIPNFLLTPHNAWASRQARQRLVTQTVENLQAWRRGEALRTVTASR